MLETKQFKISVIIPYHNASKSIYQTLKALQESSLSVFEVICVDDASTDETSGKIKDFAANNSLNVAILRLNSEKSGAAAVRNLGAKKATGDYLLFVDSDVIVEKYTIERMLCCLLERPCIAVVAQFQDYSYQPGILAHFQAYMVNAVYGSLDPNDSPCMGTQCLLMETHIFRKAGEFSELYTGATVEDFEFGYRLQAQRCKICIATDAGIIHNHQYDIKSFIRNYYAKSRDLTNLLLYKPDVSIASSGYHDTTNFSVLLVTGLEALILLAGATVNKRLLWIGAIVPVIIPLLWRGFIYQVAHRWGRVTALYFVIIRVIVVLIGWIGVTSSLITFLFKKPTNWLSIVRFRSIELLTNNKEVKK